MCLWAGPCSVSMWLNRCTRMHITGCDSNSEDHSPKCAHSVGNTECHPLFSRKLHRWLAGFLTHAGLKLKCAAEEKGGVCQPQWITPVGLLTCYDGLSSCEDLVVKNNSMTSDETAARSNHMRVRIFQCCDSPLLWTHREFHFLCARANTSSH